MPCRMCASTTHNRATCALWANLQCLVCESEDFGLAPMDVEVQPRKCGGCGEFGHNRRTCPLVKLGALSLEESSSMDVDTGIPCTKRVPRCPMKTHKAVQVTQSVVTGPVAQHIPVGSHVVDMDIVDEPWVWAPIRPMNRFN